MNPTSSPASVSVRLALDAGAVPSGHLEIANQGDAPVTLAAPYAAAALNLVVFDRQWRVVAPTVAAKAHAPHDTFQLGPGESRRFPLNGLGHATATAMLGYRLEPGEYHVVAIYHPPTHRLPDESAYPVLAASAPVPLRVE